MTITVSTHVRETISIEHGTEANRVRTAVDITTDHGNTWPSAVCVSVEDYGADTEMHLSLNPDNLTLVAGQMLEMVAELQRRGILDAEGALVTAGGDKS